MKSLVVRAPDARARGIEFIPDALVVHLEDGRSLTVPLEWFPRLRDAPPEGAQALGADRPRAGHPLAGLGRGSLRGWAARPPRLGALSPHPRRRVSSS